MAEQEAFVFHSSLDVVQRLAKVLRTPIADVVVSQVQFRQTLQRKAATSE